MIGLQGIENLMEIKAWLGTDAFQMATFGSWTMETLILSDQFTASFRMEGLTNISL